MAKKELDLINPNCSVYDVMNIIGGKWKIDIIYHLGEGTLRFGELKKSLIPITQQMLSKQLKELENDGIIKRKVYSVIPPKVEYSLTDTGNSLNPVIESILEWASYYSNKLDVNICKDECERKQDNMDCCKANLN
ncbi:MAG: transcriptional regulator [Chloroflexi bacterium]|nr:transcriptional regulator [Chloroflexota bacterium]|tara:strand:- start:1724 stop:2128 length:405 start_codon:yes stop_codon:yes gene_type:complete